MAVLATMLAQAIGDDNKPSCTVAIKPSPRLCLLFVLDHSPVFAPLGVAHVVYISFQIYTTCFFTRHTHIVLYLLHFFFFFFVFVFSLVQSGQRSSSLFKSGECGRELACVATRIYKLRDSDDGWNSFLTNFTISHGFR
jgi:hypothetical protein